eukprot:gene19960-biopygen23523
MAPGWGDARIRQGGGLGGRQLGSPPPLLAGKIRGEGPGVCEHHPWCALPPLCCAVPLPHWIPEPPEDEEGGCAGRACEAVSPQNPR